MSSDEMRTADGEPRNDRGILKQQEAETDEEQAGIDDEPPVDETDVGPQPTVRPSGG